MKTLKNYIGKKHNKIPNLILAVITPNVFTSIFDVTNYVLSDVRQNAAVVLLSLDSIIPVVFVFPYGVMRNFDAIIRVLKYVRLNPGLQRARPLWCGASNR